MQLGGGKAESPVRAIFYSFIEASNFIRNSMNIVLVILVLLSIPLLISQIKNEVFQFKNPIWVLAISYILFAVSFTPALYAEKQIGALRTKNIYYFFFVVFLFINLYYFLGWGMTRIKERKGLVIWSKNRLIQWVVLLMVLFAILVPTRDWTRIAGISVIRELVNGELQTYHREIGERYKLYYDEKISDVELQSLSVDPKTISVRVNQGITEDENWYVNQSVANYFNKKSVRIINID